MAGAPLVSCVCLTTHPRRALFLPDALRSYRAQSYAARELLIINDGAPLESAAPDVRVINLPARGRRWTVGEKRNAGIRAARGEYLATWDDDDVSLPGRLVESVEAARAWGADVVRADGAWIADAGLTLAGRCQRDASAPVQASALIRRDAAVRAGGYAAADYCEDAQIVERVRLVVRGHVATLAGAGWYVLRRHGANVTLGYGEHGDTYVACALRDAGGVRAAQRALDALRAGPGGDDVRGVRT